MRVKFDQNTLYSYMEFSNDNKGKNSGENSNNYSPNTAPAVILHRVCGLC